MRDIIIKLCAKGMAHFISYQSRIGFYNKTEISFIMKLMCRKALAVQKWAAIFIL